MIYRFLRTRVTIARSHNTLRGWLWRHNQNVNKASETGKACHLIVIYQLIVSCKNETMYALSWWTVCNALTWFFVYVYFPNFAREINTKITFLFAHKQFVTTVDIIFSIHSRSGNRMLSNKTHWLIFGVLVINTHWLPLLFICGCSWVDTSLSLWVS